MNHTVIKMMRLSDLESQAQIAGLDTVRIYPDYKKNTYDIIYTKGIHRGIETCDSDDSENISEIVEKIRALLKAVKLYDSGWLE